MNNTAPVSALAEYEEQMQPARKRFADSPTLGAVTGPDGDPLLLELFLLYFSAMGVRMTEPVEGWIRRGAQRCEELGYADLGRSLRGHAAAEAGHNLMMVRDTHALTARLNARYSLALDAESLLNAPPGAGAARYIEVHERVIAGQAPFAQVALEYEIEMLPVRYGPAMVAACAGRLGQDILGCLSFITEHIVLDVGHTKFNSRLLETLLERDLGIVSMIVAAGTDVLDAYGQFLTDCLELARKTRKELAKAVLPISSAAPQSLT
jgi:hypothetical protein